MGGTIGLTVENVLRYHASNVVESSWSTDGSAAILRFQHGLAAKDASCLLYTSCPHCVRMLQICHRKVAVNI